MGEEFVDIIDANGTFIKTVTKTEAHQLGLLHKTVIGYLKNDDQWTLVRQAADKQDSGQLVAPVGGHVTSGETEDAALLRESQEEIGVTSINFSLKGRAQFHRQIVGRDENHLFVVYEIQTHEPIVLNEESVELVRFSSTELKAALEEKPTDFGDGYYFVLERFYPEYLPTSYRHRW